MSAFMCSNNHLLALAMYVAKTVGEANDIARVLFDKNVQAMDERYEDRWREDYDNGMPPRPPKIPKQEFLVRWSPPPTPVQIIKLCQCYDYQACEAGDYEGSDAKRTIENIQYAAISKLPGYEEAPWTI